MFEVKKIDLANYKSSGVGLERFLRVAFNMQATEMRSRKLGYILEHREFAFALKRADNEHWDLFTNDRFNQDNLEGQNLDFNDAKRWLEDFEERFNHCTQSLKPINHFTWV